MQAQTAHKDTDREHRIASHCRRSRRASKQRAKQAGSDRSEWCRQAHSGCLDVPPGNTLCLQEVLAVRKIFLALQLDDVQGQQLTEDRLRSSIEQAEATKFAMAESRIHSMRSRRQMTDSSTSRLAAPRPRSGLPGWL